MKLRFFVLTFVVLLFPGLVFAQDQDHQREHDQMQKDHKAASAEHEAWLAKVSKMKTEHRKALAALARLRAEILEHEAELEAMSAHIRAHDLEIRKHGIAIHDHEEKGEGERHDELKSSHAKIMEGHTKLKKQFEDESSHHTELIHGILTFAKKHAAKFHAHNQHSGDSDHSSDHDDDHGDDHKAHDHKAHDHKTHDHDQ